MLSQPSAAHRSLVPSAHKLLSDEQPCALFYDLDVFDETLRAIKDAFPPWTNNAIAMKANPLVACLELARDAGFGVEVASPAELEHALRLGFSPAKIVFDSPAKTRRDLRRALHIGVQVNADNLEELQRIDELLTNEHGGGGARGCGTCGSRIGLRINPQYGEGAIAETGTIATTSKFGVPLKEERAAVLACYRKYAWLTGVHCHVGSQGCDVALLVRGAQSVVDLALEINTHVGTSQVDTLDIGGGMPADYGRDCPDDEAPERVTPARFAAALRLAVPRLFEGGPSAWHLVTEFGRHVSAKAGVILSKVEYVKQAGGRRIAVVHCGADLMLRTCYQPANWPHRVSAWDREGRFLAPPPPSADADDAGTRWDVVGPLCFRGDIIAHCVALPACLQSGDHILVHDAGAYTLAMVSKYNSRQVPPVYGVRNGGKTITLIGGAESVEEALRVWQRHRGSILDGRRAWAAIAVLGAAATLAAVAIVGRVRGAAK